MKQANTQQHKNHNVQHPIKISRPRMKQKIWLTMRQKNQSRETDPEMTRTRNLVVKGANMLAAWGFIDLSRDISQSWTYTQYVQEDTVMYENDKKRNKIYK